MSINPILVFLILAQLCSSLHNPWEVSFQEGLTSHLVTGETIRHTCGWASSGSEPSTG